MFYIDLNYNFTSTLQWYRKVPSCSHVFKVQEMFQQYQEAEN